MVGQIIKTKRLSLGWSVDKLARETGLSSGAIQNLESGASSPTFSTIQKIAAGFGFEDNHKGVIKLLES